MHIGQEGKEVMSWGSMWLFSLFHYAGHNCYNILKEEQSTSIWSTKEDFMEKLQLKESLRDVYTKQTPGTFPQLLHWRSCIKN